MKEKLENKKYQLLLCFIVLIAIILVIVFIMFQKKTYTVTFYVNDNVYQELNKVSDKSTIELPDNPTKEGYTFDGWYINEKKFDANTKIESNMVLEAHFTINSYTVTFNLDNEEENVTKKVNYYEVVEEPSIPSKKGYTFDGWYVNDTKYDFNTKITEDMVIQAKWTKKTTATYKVEHYLMNLDGTYTKYDSETFNGKINSIVSPNPKTMKGFTSPKKESITVNADGTSLVKYYYERNKYHVNIEGDQGIDSINGTGEYYYGSEIHISVKIKNGYTFNGWSNGKKTTDFIYTVNDQSETLKVSTILDRYTIHYDLNGGELKDKKESYTILDEDYKVSSPTKAGYTFVGWKVNEKDFDGIIKKGTYGDLKLTAIFKANENTPYVVKHYLMDLDGIHYTLKDTEEFTGTTDSVIIPETYSYDGFKSPDKITTSIKGDGTTVVEYRYERKKYELKISYINTVDKDDLEGVKQISKTTNYYYGETVNISIDLEKGFHLEEWSNGTKDSSFTYTMTASEHQSLEAKIKRNEHQVTFDSQSDSVIEKQKEYYGKTISKPEDPVKDGYDFLGWYKKDTEEQWNFEKDVMPDEDVSLYAKWEIHKDTVIFDANGGVFKDGKAEKAILNQEVGSHIKELEEQPTREGYKFDGWYKEDLSEAWNFDSDTMPDYAITIKAHWTPITYKIHFDGNTPTTGSMDDITCTYDEPCKLTSNAFKKEYNVTYENENTTQVVKYNFKNWTYNSETFEDGDEVRNLTAVENQVVTLKVEWIVDKNTTTLKEVTKTGYHFVGWYDNDNLVTSLDNISKDLTLKARWEANHYHIKYDSNKGLGSSEPTGMVENTECIYDEEKELTKQAYQRDGYTFLGWSLHKHEESVENCTDCITKANNLTDANNGEVTLYAVWKANQYTIKYNGNGNTNREANMSSTSCTYDQECKLENNIFERKYTITYDKNDETNIQEQQTVSYNFENWIYNNNKYSNESNVTNLTSEKDGTVTLDAEWKIDETTTTLKSVERTGYDFAGWYKDDQTRIENLNDVNENLTLKAHWTPITYTIIFDGNGGNHNGNSQEKVTATYDVETKAMGEFVKSFELTYNYDNGENQKKETGNATFTGWQLDGETYQVDQDLGNLTSEKGKEITLVAQWTDPTVKIEEQEPTKKATEDYYTYDFKDFTDGNSNYSLGGSITLTKDTTLTAEYLKIIDSNKYIKEKLITEGRKDLKPTEVKDNSYSIDILDVTNALVNENDVKRLSTILQSNDVKNIEISLEDSPSSLLRTIASNSITLSKEDNIKEKIATFLNSITSKNTVEEKHLGSLWKKKLMIIVNFDEEYAKEKNGTTVATYHVEYTLTKNTEKVVTQATLDAIADSGITEINKSVNKPYKAKRIGNTVYATYKKEIEEEAVGSTILTGGTGLNNCMNAFFNHPEVLQAIISVYSDEENSKNYFVEALGTVDKQMIDGGMGALLPFAVSMLEALGLGDIGLFNVKNGTTIDRPMYMRIDLGEGYVYEDGVNNIYHVEVVRPEEFESKQ